MLVGNCTDQLSSWALELGRGKSIPSPEYSTEVILTCLLPLHPQLNFPLSEEAFPGWLSSEVGDSGRE